MDLIYLKMQSWGVSCGVVKYIYCDDDDDDYNGNNNIYLSLS